MSVVGEGESLKALFLPGALRKLFPTVLPALAVTAPRPWGPLSALYQLLVVLRPRNLRLWGDGLA